MKADDVNAFVEPFLDVLGEIHPRFSDAYLGDVVVKQELVSGGEVSVVVQVSGDRRGRLVASMAVPTAMEVAEAMMSDHVDAFDETAQSAIGELLMMVAGRASTVLADREVFVKLSPAGLSYGKPVPLTPDHRQVAITIDVTTHVGPIELSLALE